MKDRKTLAKYIRISLEDADNGKANGRLESNSVKNQRDLLDDFIQKTPEFEDYEILEFCDDGWSGTNFERPAMQAMLKELENGKIDCVIVKDLSRFARNYLDAGDYLEQVFPVWGVRFISVNDMFDSKHLSRTSGIIDIAFHNLIYDIYSRDLSEKVRSARISKGKKGEFTSPHAFYGYVKSKDDKHKLVIDDEAAQVVKMIYDMADRGLSSTEIARKMNESGVPTAQMRQKQNDVNRNWNLNGKENYWERNRINAILGDERYTGKMISCKRRRYEVGKVKSKLLPEDEWLVAENALPQIISAEQFQRIREKKSTAKNQQAKNNGSGQLFYHKIKCGTCKKAMRRRAYKDGRYFYYCETSKYTSKADCSKEKIYEDVIALAVFYSIKQMMALAEIKNEKGIMIEKDAGFYESQIMTLKESIESSKNNKLSAYEDYLEAKISKEKYIEISNEIAGGIIRIEKQIAEYQNTLWDIKQDSRSSAYFIEEALKHSESGELTKAMVEAFVKAIYVYDPDRIEIIWNFTDNHIIF